MKIATTDQIREMDRQTIQDYKVSGLILMENAASGFIEILKIRFGPLKEKRIAIVCGKGNNGGDGLAIARHLLQHCKARVLILLVEDAEAFKGDAQINYKIAKKYGIKIQAATNFKFENFDFIIDAVFGTGFKRVLDESTSRIIENMNSCGLKIISVDVPSGLDADSGTAEGAVIKAALTVTFGLAKYGLLVYPGIDYASELVVVDIGTPNSVIEAAEITTFATDFNDVRGWLPPRKNQRDTNKGTFGHVIVFAGSRGFFGAPILVAEAAQRVGAGLVTLAIPDDLEKQIVSRISPVIMTRGLSQGLDTSFNFHTVPEALALVESHTVVAIGPGIGLGLEVSEFVSSFVERCPVPLVIDADALTLLSQLEDQGKSIIKNRKSATILTPHPAELARLLGMTTESIQNDRLSAIKLAVKLYDCVVLLKGSRTLTSDSSGKIYLNMTGNPGMSSGGSGDTLTGIIAGLLAQNLEALTAATAGTFLHGLAGDLVAQENQITTGMIATDLISYLPRAIAKCQQVDFS
jgi:hydroxyethylthiazole kinase-like uncharacterized protein yjeF